MLNGLMERMIRMERALQELNMTLVCSSSSAGGSEPRSDEHATATSDVTA
jgi:hypothetical protein